MAGQEIFVTVADVTSKSGTSKAQKPYTLYWVTLSDGNTYKTFKNEVATAAQQLKTTGTPGKAQVHSEKSSGDYPDDLFIDSIEVAERVADPAAQGQSPLRELVTHGVGSQSGEANGINQTKTLPPTAHDTSTPPIRDRSDDIRTQFAIKAAVNYVASNGTGDAEKDVTMVAYLAQEFYNLAAGGVEGVAEGKKELPTW